MKKVTYNYSKPNLNFKSMISKIKFIYEVHENMIEAIYHSTEVKYKGRLKRFQPNQRDKN